MRVELLIYVYGIICASMIGFNIVYNILLKSSEIRLEKRCSEISVRMDEQLKKIRRNERVEPEHLEYLCRTMCRINNLIAFDRVLTKTLEDKRESGEKYIMQIQSIFLYLAAFYKKKDTMQAGYFTYFISRYTEKRQMPIDSLQNMLLEYIKKDNLYCRFNALKALYNFASPESIVKALKLQDDGKIFFHDKLITEGLLTFRGDYHELIRKLLNSYEFFSVQTKLAILNYIRFKTGDYKKEMFAIMQDGREDKEIKLSIMRYFGRYYYPPALDILLSYVRNTDSLYWEFATVAASALAIYQGENVIEALKEALYSSNWYVRRAASKSLDAHHLKYKDLLDIVSGKDRYAKEMVMYRLELHRNSKIEEE